MAVTNVSLAPTGSVGNNTHAAVTISSFGEIAFQFVVEVAGATPTVTYKFQGTEDGVNWYDLTYVTDATDAAAQAARTATAVGAQIEFLDNPAERHYVQFRCVTSLNTNVTYRAEAWVVTGLANE